MGETNMGMVYMQTIYTISPNLSYSKNDIENTLIETLITQTTSLGLLRLNPDR